MTEAGPAYESGSLGALVWETLDRISQVNLEKHDLNHVAILLTSEPELRNFRAEELLPFVTSFLGTRARARAQFNLRENERIVHRLETQAEADQAISVCEGTYRIVYPTTNPAVLLASARTVYLGDKSTQRDLRVLGAVAWLLQVLASNSSQLPPSLREAAGDAGLAIQAAVITSYNAIASCEEEQTS